MQSWSDHRSSGRRCSVLSKEPRHQRSPRKNAFAVRFHQRCHRSYEVGERANGARCGTIVSAAAVCGGSMNFVSTQADTKLDIEKIRKDFPALHQKVYGKPLIYLDNAATTQKP